MNWWYFGGLRFDLQETVYIGDAVSDVVMAQRAGSISVAVLSGNTFIFMRLLLTLNV